MTVPVELDQRFRAAAAQEGLLDVAYDVVDSPLGPLYVAVSQAGLCAIEFDPEPERETERLARVYGVRIMASKHPTDPARRQLDEYFEGKRRRFELPVDLRLADYRDAQGCYDRVVSIGIMEHVG